MRAARGRTARAAFLAAPLCFGLYLLGERKIHVDAPGPSVRNRYWVAKTFTDSAYDMVLMGDSRSFNALSPALLTMFWPGMRALNFGYPDGGFNPVMFRAAERKFRPDAPRRILVLGVSPNSMTPKRGGRNFRYLEQAGKRADHVFAHTVLIPLLRLFDSFRPADMLDRRFGTSRRVVQEYHLDGWQPESWIPPDPSQQLPFFTARFKDNAAAPEMVDGLIDQVRDWTRQGYVVYGYRPPNTDAMVAMEDTLSRLDYADLAARFRAAGGRWFAFGNAGYASFDGSHLDRESAIRFSRAMRDSIEADLRERGAAAGRP